MQPEIGKASPERTVAGLAGNAHGVVSRAELLRAGVTVEQIKHRLARGSLIPIHRGVYRVGHSAPSREARYVAAVKACGDGATLCGQAAAHLWRLVRGVPPKPEVRAPTKRVVGGVITHRSVVDPRDRTEWHRIPVTSVPRTLVDLASSLPEPALARACHEAGVLYRTTPRHVGTVLNRLANAPGRKGLERVLNGEVRVTLSGLERRFLTVLRDARLPLPSTNKIIGQHRVDCRWAEHRLTVELDSYRFHNSHHAWSKDREREREARARRDEFRRYTPADVFDDTEFMLTELRRLLGIVDLGAI